ncbi:hypothetical protein [Egicoccus halophilus]|uniref:Uncharacterized protein n=1 Tax=Egicoccus halophilus TaxID=1670830 RepID=A0A8J3ETA1_9ACTN|nr:hypothetical protein [Egicoccus halophilus]GGI09102.1 hypothetical protein GCM10011354_32410 [Egicoccus halophilus]
MLLSPPAAEPTRPSPELPTSWHTASRLVDEVVDRAPLDALTSLVDALESAVHAPLPSGLPDGRIALVRRFARAQAVSRRAAAGPVLDDPQVRSAMARLVAVA